jgi:TrmH family RNA methyltransferase
VAALGGQAVILGETSAHPYLRRAVRSSMGTIFRLPYVVSSRLVDTLAALRSTGIRSVAAHPHSSGRTVWDVNWTQPTCVVVGAEGEGIRPEVLAACDEAVAVPMAAGVDSLNVASAAAVFLAEAVRQRRLSR